MANAAVRPFVDYYVQNNISPVHQDVRDIERHFERRASLYRLLGIVPNAVADRRVLEFGPGSGHNALYTASLRPRQYTLVDANPRGVNETVAALRAKYADSIDIAVVESLVEDFRADRPFDLVLAENLIPFQYDPSAFVRTIAGFVAKAGLLVITCIDGVSHLAEIGRRLIARRMAPPSLSLTERVALLRPVFASHVATLGAMSRSLDDWILDNITHPLVGKTFSVPAALAALGPEFDVLNSSPGFVVEWRWYKELYGEARQFNARMADAYYSNVVNVLDCRHTLPPHDAARGREIASLCESIYCEMQTVEARDAGSDAGALALLRELSVLVRPLAPASAESIDGLVSILAGTRDATHADASVRSFFGRGTQYLSFLRN